MSAMPDDAHGPGPLAGDSGRAWGELGAPGPRLPLVLLHGFAGDALLWGEVAAAAKARPLVALDLPGHGGAPLPEGLDFEAAADLVIRRLDALGLASAGIAGYSLGGRIALSLAIRHPGRVRGLVLCGAHPGLDDAARDERRAADARWSALVRERGVLAFAARWDAQPLFATRAALGDAPRERLSRARDRHDAAALAHAMDVFSLAAMPDYRSRLAMLRIPVIALAGADDAKFLALAREMAALLPSARVDVVEGAGHDLLSERPGRVALALDSLQEAMTP